MGADGRHQRPKLEKMMAGCEGERLGEGGSSGWGGRASVVGAAVCILLCSAAIVSPSPSPSVSVTVSCPRFARHTYTLAL